MLIPKIAHQIWFQDKNKINKEPYQTCHKTCLTKLKLFNWKHIIWDDKSIRKLITVHYPQYLSLYNYFDIMVQKIDLAKYIIIYHYGGVYIDMDMDCVKDLTKLINKQTNVPSVDNSTASGYQGYSTLTDAARDVARGKLDKSSYAKIKEAFASKFN